MARPRTPPDVAAAAEAVTAAAPRAVVLVEGRSDEAAVRALAARRGRDLEAERVAVLAMAGVTNLPHHVRLLGPAGAGLDLAGLYDEGEAAIVAQALEDAGLDDDAFHVCRRDLEDELLRALGVDGALSVITRAGELHRFRVFQRQPAQRDRPIEAHLHRFLGIASGRKVRYGRLLVDALDLDRVPPPLDAVLTSI